MVKEDLQTALGIVVIGRNEGERLRGCFQSLDISFEQVIYVDSGSTDNSLELAQSFGVEIVNLDPAIPFSAGRARNEGFAKLLEKKPKVKYVQFIDGDCQLVGNWLSVAFKFLSSYAEYAIVVGRCKEINPEISVYNRFCDIEWHRPTGEVKECGGIFCVKTDAFELSGGFNPEIVAGEEPELCYRLRRRGWKVNRLDCEMVMHDAAIYSFSQWWKRTVRSGHAYAQVFWLHGWQRPYYNLKNCFRIWFWALLVPVSVCIAVYVLGLKCLCLFLLYPLSAYRIAHSKVKEIKCTAKNGGMYAFFIIVGRWAQLLGQLKFIVRKTLIKQVKIVEYK